MHTYCVRRTGDCHLEHALQKGRQRQNHKYFARMVVNGKFRYFYSQAELDAYKASLIKSSQPQVQPKAPNTPPKSPDVGKTTPKEAEAKKTAQPTVPQETKKASKGGGSGKGGSGGGGKGSGGGGRGRGGGGKSSEKSNRESDSKKKSKKKVTPESVRALKDSGKTVSEIAKALGISRSKVQQLLKKTKGKGKVSLKKRISTNQFSQKTRQNEQLYTIMSGERPQVRIRRIITE